MPFVPLSLDIDIIRQNGDRIQGLSLFRLFPVGGLPGLDKFIHEVLRLASDFGQVGGDPQLVADPHGGGDDLRARAEHRDGFPQRDRSK